MPKYTSRLLMSLTVLVLLPSQVWACPMCKMALETDDPLPRAYMFSILFMLAMIGGMFGGMACLVYFLTRSERQSLDAAGYQHLFENGATQAVSNRR